jgi:ribosome maturation factor RimP
MKALAEIERLIAPTILAMGYDLWGCIFLRQGRTGVLRVYIDKDTGITVDDCQAVSQQIGAVLDVAAPVAGDYTLEVSSPGMDRPLLVREHFERYIGHTVRVVLRVPQQGRRRYNGRLQQVVDGTIVLQAEEVGLISLALMDVEKANVIPEF